MSYEPMLIISRSSLEKQRIKIEEMVSSIRNLIVFNEVKAEIINNSKVPFATQKAYFVLEEALNKEQYIVKFDEIELIIISPEGTKHNENVRGILDDLNVDYKTFH